MKATKDDVLTFCCLVIGMACVTIGLSMIYKPLGLIFIGACCLFMAYVGIVDSAKEKERKP